MPGETSKQKIPYALGADKPPSVPTITKSMAERLETLLNAPKLTPYTPKIIATEQTRESTEFGTLATADEITNIVVPENGLLLITYHASVKSSVSAAGRVQIYIGANTLKYLTEASTVGTGFREIYTDAKTLEASAVGEADVTTGQVAGNALECFLAAGTYAVAVKFRATSGSVTAKDRKLWVRVIG